MRAGNPSPTANLFIHAFIPRATLTHDAGRMVYLLVSPYAAVAPSAAPVLVAFFVAYCWVAHALAHRSSPMIVLRLGLALGEMAFVAHSFHRPGHIAYICAGIVLAIDVALRWGPAGILIPIVLVGIPTVLYPTDVATVVTGGGASISLGTALGWGIRIYSSRRDRSLDRQEELLTSAAVNAAHLAGRNEVVMRCGETADLVQRAGVLLELSGEPSDVRRRVAADKAGLAEETRRQAWYVGDLLNAWQRRRHDTQADLTRAVAFDIDPAIALVILTGPQAASVWRWLDAAPPAGLVPVGLHAVDPNRPDIARTLVVGDRRFDLPVDPDLRSTRRSPIPTAIAMIGLWMLAPVAMDAARWSVVLPVMSTVSIAMAFAAGYLLRRTDRAVLLVYPVVVAWVTGFCCFVARLAVLHPIVQLPASGAVEYLTFLTLVVLPSIPGRWRLALYTEPFLGILFVAMPGIGRSGLRHLAAETIAIPMMGALMFDAGPKVERHSAAVRESWIRRRGEGSAAAYERGRDLARASLSGDLAGLRTEFRAAATKLDRRVSDEIERRLDAAEASLTAG